MRQLIAASIVALTAVGWVAAAPDSQLPGAPTSVTPSWRIKNGRNGITSVKPVKPMNEAAVTANRLRRQWIRTVRTVS